MPHLPFFLHFWLLKAVCLPFLQSLSVLSLNMWSISIEGEELWSSISYFLFNFLQLQVQDLRVASPATVSRCGMVFVDPEELKWMPYVKTWMKSISKKVSTTRYTTTYPSVRMEALACPNCSKLRDLIVLHGGKFQYWTYCLSLRILENLQKCLYPPQIRPHYLLPQPAPLPRRSDSWPLCLTSPQIGSSACKHKRSLKSPKHS